MPEQRMRPEFDRYNLIEPLGGGQISTVYRAFDNLSKQDVALKIFHQKVSTYTDFDQEFETRLQHLSTISQAGLIDILDYGRAQTQFYVSMPYVAGQTLQQMLRDLLLEKRWIPLKDAIPLVHQVISVVSELHRQQLYGFDVRPNNLMFIDQPTDGLPYQVMLTDVGLNSLKWSSSAEHMTAAHISLLPPEILFARPPDVQSDVFSLGTLLHLLVTQQSPFRFADRDEAIAYFRTIRPHILQDQTDIPVGLAPILQRALATNPAHRYEDAASFADDLTPLMTEDDQSRNEPNSSIAEIVETLSDPVEVLLTPDHLVATPGQTTIATVTILNYAPMSDHFHLSISGVEPSWITEAPPIVPVPANHQQTVRIAINPPINSRTRAGRHPLKLAVTSNIVLDDPIDITRTLTISAYQRFQSALWPDTLNAGARGQITIENRGNTPQAYTLTFFSHDPSVAFNVPQKQWRIDAGQSALANFRVDVQNLRLFGGERAITYNVRVDTPDEDFQSHEGLVISKGMVPVWLAAVAIFLCLTALIGSGFFYNIRARQIEAVTATANALIEAPKATQTARTLYQEATAQAVTATAIYLNQDDDRDGLTNGQELEYNTLPNKRDTDEDGLDDNDEIIRQTDPLNPDTDNDGLKDGEEISRGINPLNPDTDNDGTTDAVDPDPGRVPTTTPNPTLTPTPFNQPPIVTLIEPVGGSNFLAPADIVLRANSTDPDGAVTRVDFFAGPALIGSVSQAPYDFVWTVQQPGTYRLTSIATDDKNATATSAQVDITVTEPTNALPTVNIAEPLAGATFDAGGNILIAVITDDADGYVNTLQFYANTVLLEIIDGRRTRYEYLWRNVIPGTYTLSAIAVDDKGGTTVAVPIPITVREAANIPPTVELEKPSDGDSLTVNSAVELLATANDIDGEISQVDFYVGGSLIGSRSTAPYRLNWTAGATGEYVLTADAIDDDGARQTSEAVTVTITSSP
ncbi:MAG: Ig-like domain-containing protein [Chloroflexota bacterium]